MKFRSTSEPREQCRMGAGRRPGSDPAWRGRGDFGLILTKCVSRSTACRPSRGRRRPSRSGEGNPPTYRSRRQAISPSLRQPTSIDETLPSSTHHFMDTTCARSRKKRIVSLWRDTRRDNLRRADVPNDQKLQRNRGRDERERFLLSSMAAEG